MNQIKLELMQQSDLPQVVAIADQVKLSIWRIDDYKEELGRKDSYLLTAKKYQTIRYFELHYQSVFRRLGIEICPFPDLNKSVQLIKVLSPGIRFTNF
jgi:hypothetical protein